VSGAHAVEPAAGKPRTRCRRQQTRAHDVQETAPSTLVEGLTPAELSDARKWLSVTSSVEALQAFVLRQRASRRGVTLLADFYRAHPCRMARVHLLVASAVALGRFWGVSVPFARLGAAVLPVDSQGRPRTAAWASYARACEENFPLEIRDERWIDAHLQDATEARDAGLEAAFLAEVRAHDGEPLWRLLVQHLDRHVVARGPARGSAGPHPLRGVEGLRNRSPESAGPLECAGEA